MYIRGQLIGTLKANSKNERGLLDRTIEIYESKQRYKVYLFNSSTMNWHQSRNIIKIYSMKKENKIDGVTIKEISKVMKDIEKSENIKLSWDGNIYQTKLRYNDNEN